MNALDILEKRIDTLDHIIGPIADFKAGTTAKNTSESERHNVSSSESIVGSLLVAANIMNEAIKDREHIKRIISRNNELEKYLGPNFLEECQQVRTKGVYLNAIGHDLHKQCSQLERVKELEHTLGAEYFRNIPEKGIDKLKEINEDNKKFSEEVELMEKTLVTAMKRYGDIQNDLLESLKSMGRRIGFIEEKLQQKKHEEMEKDLP